MWIVMTSAAAMPSSCWGRYRNVALVQLTQYATARDLRPSQIRPNKALVARIQHLGHHNEGMTERCAYARKLREAEAEAHRRNNLTTIPDYSAWGGSA